MRVQSIERAVDRTRSHENKTCVILTSFCSARYAHRWEAPETSGIAAADAEMARRSTAEAAEDSLWDDLAPDDPDETSPSTNMSENILGDAKEAVNTMDVDALSEAAEVFDKLAAHGKGFTVLDMQGFQELMLKLSQDEKGKKLLKLLMGNVETKVRRNSRER